MKPIKKEIMKPPLYLSLYLASSSKWAHGRRTPTPSTTTRQPTSASLMNHSRSIATAKSTATSPVPPAHPAMKTHVQYEEDNRELPMENIYICSIFFDKENRSFHIQSADVSGVQPHPVLRADHPDIFRNAYLVIRDFEKDEGIEGYPLCTPSSMQRSVATLSSDASSTLPLRFVIARELEPSRKPVIFSLIRISIKWGLRCS